MSPDCQQIKCKSSRFRKEYARAGFDITATMLKIGILVDSRMSSFCGVFGGKLPSGLLLTNDSPRPVSVVGIDQC